MMCVVEEKDAQAEKYTGCLVCAWKDTTHFGVIIKLIYRKLSTSLLSQLEGIIKERCVRSVRYYYYYKTTTFDEQFLRFFRKHKPLKQ